MAIGPLGWLTKLMYASIKSPDATARVDQDQRRIRRPVVQIKPRLTQANAAGRQALV